MCKLFLTCSVKSQNCQFWVFNLRWYKRTWYFNLRYLYFCTVRVNRTSFENYVFSKKIRRSKLKSKKGKTCLKTMKVPFLIPENIKNLDLKYQKLYFWTGEIRKLSFLSCSKQRLLGGETQKLKSYKFMVMTSWNISSLKEPVKKVYNP